MFWFLKFVEDLRLNLSIFLHGPRGDGQSTADMGGEGCIALNQNLSTNKQKTLNVNVKVPYIFFYTYNKIGD